MKTILTIIIATIILWSCSNNPIEPEIIEVTKTVTITVHTTNTITISSTTFPIDPQQFKGAFVYQRDTSGGLPAIFDSFYIESHTATVLTVADHHRTAFNIGTSNPFYIIDGTYETYVLDLSQTSQFAPTELPNIDRYDFEINMLRYES